MSASDKGTPRFVGWSRLWLALRGHRAAMGGLAVGSVLAGIAESGILAVLAQSAALLVEGSSHIAFDVGSLSVSMSLSALLSTGFALALFRLALQLPLSILPARVVVDLQVSLGTDLFGAFSRAPWAVQSRDREGHLQELVSEQVAIASNGALLASSLLTAVLTFGVMMISALLLNAAAAAVVLVAAAAIFALLRPLSSLGERRARAASDTTLEYAGGIGEAVRLAEETHAFGVVEAQRERIAALAQEARHPLFHTQLLARLTPGIYQGLIYYLILAGLGILHWAGVGQVTLLGTVVLILVRAGSYGQQAQSAYQGLRQTLPYLERVQESLRRYETAAPAYGEQPLDTVRTLALEGVGFEYERGRPVLTDIDFEVSAGEAIGIVGPSGAGKSTLVQVLLGLRGPGSGQYLVNGVTAERFSREDWHRLFAYVPQRPRLLHASVTNNIRFMRDLDDEAVRRAARLAGIHEEIESWPRGYDTVVGPRADAVSGGQEQRICLARALAARPNVLLLDEPTASLDSSGERLIKESLADLKHELTVFIVAHRIAMLEICERAMVIVDGRLETFTATDQLWTNSAYYRSATLAGQVSSPPSGLS